MNEIALLREQLEMERARAVAVGNACARALVRADAAAPAGSEAHAALQRSCADYLAAVLGEFAERDRRTGEVCARLPADDPGRRMLEPLLAQPAGSREALATLATVCDSRPAAAHGRERSWPDLAQYLGTVWSARRAAIEALLAAHRQVSDWRLICGIDADSILAARKRYARLRAALPVQLGLPAQPA
jgi:hypothetical protein